MGKSKKSTAGMRKTKSKNNMKKKNVKKMTPSNPISTMTTTPTLLPPYPEMISEAITTMKERMGSTQQAITKYLEGKYGATLPLTFKKTLSIELKRLAKEGGITKTKNAYKISATTTAVKKTDKGVTKAKATATNSTEITATTATAIDTATLEESGKVVKMKRLSQVTTPEALKKKKKAVSDSKGGKMKQLSQVKTPDALKKRTSKGAVSKSKTSRLKK